MANVRAERVAAPPKLPEPLSGHGDGTKVTRIEGPSPGAIAGKVDPFLHLPVHGAPDPSKQKEMIGKGGVTRQTGVLHQDAQGSLRVDVPKDFAADSVNRGIIADRRVGDDEDQVSIVDPSQLHRPVVQGGTEKVGVVGFKGDKDYQDWLDKVKAGDPQRAALKSDAPAPGVQMPDIPVTSRSQLPGDQTAAFAHGRAYAADRIAGPMDQAKPVRYADLHDPKAGKQAAREMEQAHAEADRVVEGSRQRRAAPRKAKRRTASQRSRQRQVARPAQPSATGGAPEDAAREKEAD